MKGCLTTVDAVRFSEDAEQRPARRYELRTVALSVSGLDNEAHTIARTFDRCGSSERGLQLG